MQPQTRRSLDGLLAIGPHGLDAQFRALTAYAASTEHALDVCWLILPGEDPALHAPDSGVPIVVFDDEIAGFTDDELRFSDGGGDWPSHAATDWHVAHSTPQLKRRTRHLPVFGFAERGETSADAILCIGVEPLDRQIARIEAYALRSAIRIRGVYLARDAHGLRVMLRDFSVCSPNAGAGVTLTVGAWGEVEVHP
jgi:hypothetical protein